MSPFVAGFDPPGKRVVTSTTANRDPCRLASIIGEHFARGFVRYARRDLLGDGVQRTFCNVLAQDVCEAMGVLLPRYTVANDLVLWLASPAGAAAGWETVPEHVAQRMADVGQLALAAWHSGGPTSGHLAVLVPSLGEAGTWIAQAGLENFTRGRLQSGFGPRPVTFFAHP